MIRFISLLLFFCALPVLSQVKVGDNASQINVNSLLELESTTKTFVLNRMTSIQMNSIVPLQGSIVYNTDENCVFLYKNTTGWENLCVGGTTVTTSPTAPVDSQIGDIWVDNREIRDIISIWDGVNWIPINNNPKSGIIPPTITNPQNSLAGDIYVNEVTGELYTFNGNEWLNSADNTNLTGENGITKTADNKLQLGGVLIQPTEIITDATNTLAITGLEEAVIDDETEVVTINKSTGTLQSASLASLYREDQVVTFAVDGQTQFTTPHPVTDVFKIYVYRNGVRLGFTKVDNSTIELETGVFCYRDDEIRIVQKY